jgi:hypothetical protein
MGWTHWKLLANQESWYSNEIKYQGPACYELGIRGKWKQYVIPVYVGNTDNLFRRMDQYGRNGSHLRKLLLKYRNHDYALYFRYSPHRMKSAAQKEEKDLLLKFGLERYPWNTQLG